jgi:hypothetical protein
MEHTKTPATIYDLAPLASVAARYNVRHFDSTLKKQLNDLLNQIVTDMEQAKDKPILPHTAPEATRGALMFIDQIRQLVTIAIDSGKMPTAQGGCTNRLIGRLESQLLPLLASHAEGKWQCDPKEIDQMFGIPLASPNSLSILDHEIGQWSQYSHCDTPSSLLIPVSKGEAKRISKLVREKILGVIDCHPDIYIDDPAKHHLFWTAITQGQECAVPKNYSLADYLRFHVPHNDAHLCQLKALADEGKHADAYFDHMDERAFFEAVAVHSEWKIHNHLKKDCMFSEELHQLLNPKRARAISSENLRQWTLQIRAYEFRLRTARLLADVFTIRDRLPFNEVVCRTSSILGVSKQDATAEVQKYYHFAGLGGMYTLGYQKLINERSSGEALFHSRDGKVVRAWHQFT